MAKNIAVGILRPPHTFFYEVDVKKGKFRVTKKRLIEYARRYFTYSFSIFRTMHGYHIMAYPFRATIFVIFKRIFHSDFTRRLQPRFGKKEPQILRISEKWNLKTGKIVSPKPKLVYGNLILENIQQYKVMYYAK